MSASDRWVFGEPPLEQTVELAGAMREVLERALALEQPDPAVDELVASLRAAVDRLGPAAAPIPRVGDAADGDGRVYVDHARDVGAFNPVFPPYEITVDGDRATGTATFSIAYEGPPGLVHGGVLAQFFDAVVQHHNCDAGVAGKTTAMELRYRRPTPLGVELRFEVDRRLDDGRIESVASLFNGDDLCCQATVRAVAGSRSGLSTWSPRRDPA
jgi:hypothetical protein